MVIICYHETMLKSATKTKQPPKKSPRNLRHLEKYFQQKFRKHPIISATGLILIAVVLCASPYYLSSASPIFSILTGGDEKTSEAATSESVDKLGDIASSTKTGKTNAEATANDEDSIDIDREGVGKITKPTSRCRGVGCPTANPAYSITVAKSFTVIAGTSAGPFTSTTSNGWAVHWSSPVCNSSTLCPYSFGYGDGRTATATNKFYLRAEANVPPGSYTLYMSALHPASETLVKASVTVTVLAASTPNNQTFSPPPQSEWYVPPSASTPPPYPTMSPTVTPTPTPTP